ncbi:hypothetical protein [Aureimonas sp. SA4125]|uniref:hypothetical protein n=1 Tax=Aureimonas sp. SA4125 TaxID=2826993 RepID=UPI001CC5A5E5|nr:hypothetical protein [Aureimonas sp. SA4125]
MVASYNFSARADGLPGPWSPVRPPAAFPQLSIAGGEFDCKSQLDKEKLCGTVHFSAEPLMESKRVLSMQMVQNVVGMTPEQIVAKLGEKYGPHTDSFDVVVSGESSHRARQYVWGAPFPLDDKNSGSVTFARQENNWQIEAVVFEPEMNRAVLLLQLIGARRGSDAVAGASDVRL